MAGGAAAVEIEDQVAPKRAHHHKGVEHLVSAEEMAGRIRAASEARRTKDLVPSDDGVQSTFQKPRFQGAHEADRAGFDVS